MAIIVEDGTGKSDAESYATVAYAITRHANLGNTAWALLTTEQQEQSLRLATEYLVQKYRSAIQGARKTSTQALDWPRYSVYVDGFLIPSDVVPVDWQNACCDLALKSSEGTLLADLERGVKREKVGPLETEFFEGSPESTRYQTIELMLQPYLSGRGSLNIEAVRA